MDEYDRGAMGLWTMGSRLWGTREDGRDSGTGLQTLGRWDADSGQTGLEQTEDFGAEAGDLYQLHIHNHTH